MKEELEKKFRKMSPKGSFTWFYSEHIKGKVDNVSHGHFGMMISGTRTMRPEVKEIINEFLNQVK